MQIAKAGQNGTHTDKHKSKAQTHKLHKYQWLQYIAITRYLFQCYNNTYYTKYNLWVQYICVAAMYGNYTSYVSVLQ